MGFKGDHARITILHRNVPNMIGQFTAILADEGINIANMTNKSKNQYAYTMIDIENELSVDIEKKLNEINEVLRVRIIA